MSGRIHTDSLSGRGSYRAADCKIWFRQLIDACVMEGVRQPTFIIDNAPVHANLESVITSDEDVELIRLAPYSYLLNPIELLWSSFKTTVKRKLQDRMAEILNYTRVNRESLTISDFRMTILEDIASSSIQEVQGQHLYGYTSYVE